MGSDPENMVGNQENGFPGKLGSSVLQMTGVPGHCRPRTRAHW